MDPESLKSTVVAMAKELDRQRRRLDALEAKERDGKPKPTKRKGAKPGPKPGRNKRTATAPRPSAEL